MEDIKTKIQSTKAEFYQKLNTFMLAGFSFVAGLAWNDAVQSLFAYVWPEKGGSVMAKFLYAIVVTVTLTIVSIQLSKKAQV